MYKYRGPYRSFAHGEKIGAFLQRPRDGAGRVDQGIFQGVPEIRFQFPQILKPDVGNAKNGDGQQEEFGSYCKLEQLHLSVTAEISTIFILAN